jgi:hypothetical protein
VRRKGGLGRGFYMPGGELGGPSGEGGGGYGPGGELGGLNRPGEGEGGL